MSVITLLKEVKDLGMYLWVTPEGALGFKAPKGTMTPALAGALKADKPAIIELFKRSRESVKVPGRAPEDEAPLLSSDQKRLYFIETLMPGTLIYHLPGGITIKGDLQADLLESAFRHIIARHEVLRTGFRENQGAPYPIIARHCPWDLERVDARALSDQQVEALVQDFFALPFDLTRAPLMRARLLVHAPSFHTLLWDIHHIITDDWSMQLFFQELAASYTAFRNERQPGLAELTHQFRDFAWWQNQYVSRDARWWTGKLADAPQLRLPTDHPRPPVERHRGDNHPIFFEGSLARAVSELAVRKGYSPFMVYLTVFGLVFQRLSGQDDFMVGTTFGNRDQPEWERVLGFFINTLPLRLKLQQATVAQILADVSAICLEAYAHGQVPFDAIVDHMALPRDPSRHPLFQVLFTYTNAPKAHLAMGDLVTEPLEWDGNRVARMDMTITLDDRSDCVQGHIEYNCDLFNSHTIRNLLACVERVLVQITDDVDIQTNRLQFFSPEEESRLQSMTWERQAEEEVPDEVQAFKQMAYADLPAMVGKDDEYSYAETLRPVDAIGLEPSLDENAPGLSAGQKRVYFIEKLMPGTRVNHVPGGISLKGPLQVDLLERAFCHLIERHEVLRTGFLEDLGEPYPVIAGRCPWSLEQVDARGLSAAASEDLAASFFSQPFNLHNAPLMRAQLVQHDAEHYHLLWEMHHIITDDWSMQQFLEELAATYTACQNGEFPALPELTHQFGDYVRSQDRNPSGDVNWWVEALADAPQLRLPTDGSRPPVESHCGGQCPFLFRDDLARAVTHLARQRGCSPFMVYLTAFGLVFARLSGQDRFVVGTTFDNRDRPELARVQGLFANFLPLHLDLRRRDVTEVLTDVSAVFREAHAHGQVPFHTIVEQMGIPRDRSRHPLFQIVFTYTSAPKANLWPDELSSEPLDLGDHQPARMDMAITLDDSSDSVRGRVVYSSDLYKPQTIKSLLARVERVLEQITADAGITADLQVLSDAELTHLQTIAWGERAESEHPHIVTVFRQVVDREPERLALIGDVTVTYREAWQRVEALAGELQAAGVRPGDLVGVCLSRQPHLPLAIFSVLAAGAAYVPLDPNWPQSRTRMVCEDADLRTILVDETTARLWDGGQQTLRVDQPNGAPGMRSVPIHPQSLAYIIYTSGSTGRPKGVAVSHQSLASFIAWGGQTLMQEELAGVFAGTSATFDVSICELLVPLANGGTIIMGENALDLVTHPHRERVRMFNTVPSAMVELVAQGAIPQNVCRVNLAGEALPASLLKDILTQTHLRKVVNLYGPTEDTVYATMAVLDQAGEQNPVLGQSLANKDAWVLDRTMRLQPPGTPGELYLGGPGLAWGYWGQPALTAQRFRPHPFATQPGSRLYQSGDLVCRDAGGELHFIGRLDHQVKINGYRIELGEVSHHLRALPEVREAEVVAREVSDHQLLIGFVCLQQPDAEPRIAGGFQAVLCQRLPAYMVPQLIISLPKFPLNANGKVDKRALGTMPLPGFIPSDGPDGLPLNASSQTDVDASLSKIMENAPAGSLLAEIVRLWEEVLARPLPSPEANFFELGGNSLKAMRLVGRFNHVCQMNLTLADFMNAATPKQMVRSVGEKGARQTRSLVELRPGQSNGLTTYLIHAAMGTLLPYGALVEASATEGAVWGLQATDSSGTEIADLATRYLQEAGLIGTTGSICLIGWSLGGLIAWEMAARLNATKHAVKIILLDSYPLWHMNLSQPRDLLAAFGRDMGLSEAELLQTAHRVPSDWDGDRLELLLKESALPETLTHWSPQQLETLWRNYTAHHRAASTYVPPKTVSPLLLTASDHGSLPDAATCWREAGYHLEARMVGGTHNSILTSPAVVEVARVIGEALSPTGAFNTT